MFDLFLYMNFNYVYNCCRYRVARVEWIEDIQPTEGSPESEDVSLIIFFVYAFCADYMGDNILSFCQCNHHCPSLLSSKKKIKNIIQACFCQM